ncbi:hypothetical protein L3Q82_011394 [Scortum barcoo]|uniref:Uncharacterized protein n=1 Tax=Scortum barcoo TaxID=214431 RepID=A0ACB8WAA0_9TELE|nr:hypothetical protein L3Q82_011394 [Scortum barcoo]
MEVGDSTSGVANWGGGPSFLKRGTGECVPTTEGITLLSLPGKVSRQGTGEENSAYSRPLDSGGTMRFQSWLQEHWTSSIPSTGVLEGLWEFAQPVHMCFVDLEKAFDRVPRGILWECSLDVWGPGAFAKGCSVSVRPVSPVAGAWFALPAMMLSCWLHSSQDLQHVLERFAAECEAAGMRISTSKSEAMVLDRKRVACPLRVGGEVLPQVEEFKYLGVLFTSEGKMEREIDRRIGAASAVMRSVYRTVVVKKELSRKAKLSIYRSIYVPTLTYGHELWVMTDRKDKIMDTSGRRNEFPPQGGWALP